MDGQGSGNQLITGIRSRRAFENLYQDNDQYLPGAIKNQARYMGFIRGQPKIKAPRQNVTFENITTRVGNNKLGEIRKAQSTKLATEVGPSLMHIFGKQAKDIKRVKAFVNEQSAQNWITDRQLKGWNVEKQDPDNDLYTPDNDNVTNSSGFYSIDGYRAVEPKQRVMLSQYYGKYPKKLDRMDNSYGSWYDKTIRTLIPAPVGKQLFDKAVHIILNSNNHSIEENHGNNQAVRRKYQSAYLGFSTISLEKLLYWKIGFCNCI
ncbi:MAG: hypothetical protein EZS28_045543, partial [Streblomastix strix]